jgi:hypothetical protein
MNAIPKRGVVATALTAVALALVLSFKTPNMGSLAAGNGNAPVRAGAPSAAS